jgi:hypothetical protein
MKPKKNWIPRMKKLKYFVHELIRMTKREQTVVELIINNISYDNKKSYYDYVVKIDPYTCEDASIPYQSFLKGFNLLRKKDLARRISKNKYMLNPEFVIPSKEYSLFTHIWSEATHV